MTDSIDVLLGRIDERTQSIQKDVLSIKDDISSLYSRTDTQKSQLDTLQAEHNDRKVRGDCVQDVSISTPPVSKWVTALASAGGVGGITSVIMLIIIIALLKKLGLL